ncbi:MAG: ROK family protein [Armatimonadetes bacterium]|nr:ROK family protein [Armatimonadota bacterium]
METTLLGDLAKPKIVPPLDPGFRPAVLADRAFRQLADRSGAVRCVIGLERPDGTRARHSTTVFADDDPLAPLNLPYIERTVKFLLWQRGGWKITVGGPESVWEHVARCYSPDGARAFDAKMVGETMFEREMEVVRCDPDDVPEEATKPMPVGRHLDGCRVGFDLGASDRKSAAVIDGETVFTEEVVWDPRGNSDPEYHYREIKSAIESAAEHLPRIDAIGGSSAGVIIENRVLAASLFRGVPEGDFDRVRDIFLRIGDEYGVPIEVANDGDVTALAGAMSLDARNVLGIAMGSSEAAGYVDGEGNITGWLNELAFAPIDYSPSAPADEWSGDIGCGVQYLTQEAVFRLADRAGFDTSATDVPAERLKIVQDAHEAGNEGARLIWETIGTYCGYALAHYAQFYEFELALILGRVTSGAGGQAIIEGAQAVLDMEFPELAGRTTLRLPDEQARRIGQAVAAASLPET